MRYFTKFFLLIIFLCSLFFSINVPADSTIIDITIEPVDPLPLSTITFMVTIDNVSNIEDARLIFQECREDMCFVEKWNESMNEINGVYQTSITLLHEQATQCKYSIAIKENGTWLNSEPAFFNLRIDDQENLSNNVTPGFEFVFALCTIAAAIFLLEVKKDA